MATHTFIEIPKTTSGPADPRAPSILTTLPPEIRNRIYGYLFEEDGPIIFRDDHAHLDHAGSRLHGVAERHVEEENLRNGFGGGVRLLLSCRQIYHEAVGILYGENTFMFSRGLFSQMDYICTWLASIGSHYQLLSRVQIDADVFVAKRMAGYDLLPLLKLIWNHPQAKCGFAFVLSGNLSTEEHGRNDKLYGPIGPVDYLNNVLFALGTTDALKLRQYAKYSGLISSIMVWYTASTYLGYVTYNDDDDRPCRFSHPVRHFELLSHGSKVQWNKLRHFGLLSLTDEFLSAINSYTRASDTDVVFDLNTKKVRGYHVGLGGVSNLLRFDIDRMTTRVYDNIVIRMSTLEATTDFDDFKALQKLLDVDNFRNLVNPYECREEHCSINIVLMFKLSTPEPIADLRININKLLHTFKRDHGGLNITIQKFDSSVNGTQSIEWHHVQKAVFLLLSDILV